MTLLKRALAACLVFTVVLIVGAWIATKFVTDEGVRQPDRAPPTAAKPWDGQLTRAYNVAFVRRGAQINLVNINYTDLDRAATDVTINLTVIPSSPGQPEWLTTKAFQVRSVQQRVYDPEVEIEPVGPGFSVTIALSDLPTAGLTVAPAEDQAVAEPDSLGLFTYSPNGLYVIQLIPPPPPAGHNYAENTALPAECVRAEEQILALTEKFAARQEAIDDADSKSERSDLRSEDKDLRDIERPQRQRFEEILETPRCNPPEPSKGRKLNSKDRKRDRAAKYDALGIPDPAIERRRERKREREARER